MIRKRKEKKENGKEKKNGKRKTEKGIIRK